MRNLLPRIRVLGSAVAIGLGLAVPFNTRADDEDSQEKVFVGCVHNPSACTQKAHDRGFKYHAAMPDSTRCDADHLACFGWNLQ